MKDKGLLIRELAEEIGIHKFTLIKWEGEKQVPRYKTEILKLVKALPGAGRFLVEESRRQLTQPSAGKARTAS